MGDYENRARRDNPMGRTKVNFGTKVAEFDRSVTIHKLTPEEMEQLTSGEKTYEELIADKEPIEHEVTDKELTRNALVALRHKGLTDTQIRKMYGLGPVQFERLQRNWNMTGVNKVKTQDRKDEEAMVEKKKSSSKVVSHTKYSELLAEHEVLQKRYREEKAKGHAVQEYIEQIKELEQKLKQIREEREAERNERDVLSEKYAEVTKRKNGLLAENHELKEQNQRLLAEVKRLQTAQQEMPNVETNDIEVIRAERELFRNAWLESQRKGVS